MLMQFEGLDDMESQRDIHLFSVQVEKLLSKNGFEVLMGYSCGPCRVCGQGCAMDEDCRSPEARRFALESCGFWINKLCELASENTIHGDDNWKIEWVRDFMFEHQEPKRFRSITGILLK